jgi:hypothetical protein
VSAREPPPERPLPDRIAAWAAIVAQVEAGYRLGLDDWLNDMDLRRGIGEALAAMTPVERLRHRVVLGRLAAIDDRFRRATREIDTCVWGSAVAAREGWRADRHWWYFRRPRTSNPELVRGFERMR